MTIDNPKSDLSTITVFGMEIPIIADLGDGWFLVAHPNGAAIATKTFLAVLWFDSREEDRAKSGSRIPESVRAKAVEEFERFAWPLVRGQFYTEAKDKAAGRKPK